MSTSEQLFVEKLKALSPEHRATVEVFVDFLVAKAEKHAALDRPLVIAPAVAAADIAPSDSRLHRSD